MNQDRLFRASLFFNAQKAKCELNLRPHSQPVKTPVLGWHSVLSRFYPCIQQLEKQSTINNRRRSRGGEMGEFSPLFFRALFFLFFYPSNIEIIFDFSDIITKIHPNFKILDPPLKLMVNIMYIVQLWNKHYVMKP